MPRNADLKFVTADDAFTPSGLKDDTPYTVMFGPDKCGATNKVRAAAGRGELQRSAGAGVGMWPPCTQLQSCASPQTTCAASRGCMCVQRERHA